ncbi:lysozyme inhibitor LprI family protein [Pseudomonas sp. CCNWLW23]|uniref:lysozyme inhibitor LprI family protein n=1 Tax=Pseudomonas sp. CCNWLW23 TaxID=3126385 RepID=UPI003012E5B2
MFARFIALSFGCLFASFAMAEDDCKEITVSAQVDRCVEAARKEADTQLNASYKKLLGRFEAQQRRDPEQGKALVAMARESQLAWIKLRDTTCPLEATEIEPGVAAHVTTISNCMARISLERAAYLDTIVADEPGNVVDLNKVYLSGSQRFGDVVARYVSTFGSPCLTVQILAPNGGWRVLSSKRFCSFEGKAFWTDYADAGFEDHVFAEDGLHVTLSLTELRGLGEKRLACVIPIKNEQIKELKCGAPEPGA